MEIIDNLQNLKNLDGRSVVTIGNFDGVHAGHRELINEALALANVNNMNPVVLTFDPLPEEFFERKGFFKLMPIADKLEYFRTAGIKTVIKVPFSKKNIFFTYLS